MTRYLQFPLICLALLISACSSDDDTPAPGQGEGDGNLLIRLIVQGSGTASRATANDTWGDAFSNLEQGNAFENTVSDLSLHIFAGNNQTAITLKPILLGDANTDPSTGTVYYQCLGIVTPQQRQMIENQTCKVVVVANYHTPGVVTPTTQADIENLTFSANAVSHIPMWGSTEWQVGSLNAGVRENMPDIWLLRAMAKVEVTLDMDPASDGNFIGSGAQFGATTVSCRVSHGYVAPSNAFSCSSTLTLGISSGISQLPITDVTVEDVRPFSVTNQKLEFYLPEYLPSHFGGQKPKLNVTLTAPGHDPVHDVVEIDTSSLPYAPEAGTLLRGHSYRIILHKAEEEDGPRFKASIAPLDYKDEYVFEYE